MQYSNSWSIHCCLFTLRGREQIQAVGWGGGGGGGDGGGGGGGDGSGGGGMFVWGTVVIYK